MLVDHIFLSATPSATKAPLLHMRAVSLEAAEFPISHRAGDPELSRLRALHSITRTACPASPSCLFPHYARLLSGESGSTEHFSGTITFRNSVGTIERVNAIDPFPNSVPSGVLKNQSHFRQSSGGHDTFTRQWQMRVGA